MEQMKQYMEYAVQVTQRLLAADSPSGFTRAAEEVLLKELSDLGCEPKRTVMTVCFCRPILTPSARW